MKFKMTTEAYGILNDMPGYKRWDGRDLLFRPVMACVAYIAEHFGPTASWCDGAEAHLETLAKVQADAAAVKLAKASITGDDGANDDHEYKLEPWAHQRRAFLVSRERPLFALLMEQRTGKTKVTIDTASYLWKRGRVHTLIVVSVNGVHRNWIDTEIPKHMPDWCKYKAWFSRSSAAQKHQIKFLETRAYTAGLRVFAFNIEAFSREGRTTERFHEAMTSMTPGGVLLVMDESTRIKNPSSGRAKFLGEYGGVGEDAQKAGYRRILTGTPYVRDPMDFFGQFQFLDPNILGLDTATAFKARYCLTKTFERGGDGKYHMVSPDAPRTTGDRYSVIAGVRNSQELTDRIDGVSIRVLRQDVFKDMPPKVYKRYPVELTKEQARLYKQLKQEYIAEFNGRTVTAAMAMVRAIRLQQVVCNWWPMDEEQLIGGETWKDVQPISKDNPRLEALENIIRSTDDKVIVWARFRPDLQLIQQHFGKQCVSYHGGVTDEARARNKRRFLEDPECRIMAGHAASLGLGHDLSHAGVSVYYSNDYDLEHRLQSEDRTEGANKTSATLVWDIEAPGTQDSKVIANLKAKKVLADILNNDPVSFFMDSEED